MAEEFKELSDAEHIRIRPSMYIGSIATEAVDGIIDGKYQTIHVVPGLIKIISEIIDNSIDEFIRTDGKFGNKIQVTIKKDDNLESPWQVTVKDNGRGIPVEKHGESWRPIIAWTKARAGSNFSDENRVTVGANGVGSFATNCFSTEFIGKTSDGKNELTVVCANLAKVQSVNVKTSTNRGTTVSFRPDLTAFGLVDISDDHILAIRDRLRNAAICFPGLQFIVNDEKIQFKNAKEVGNLFGENHLTYNDENSIIVFAPSGKDEEFRLLTYVNGLNIKNGGTHTNFILDRVIETLRLHVKKKHKIDVLPNQIKQHLLIASFHRNFPNARFDSQSKERITNTVSEVSSYLSGFDFDKIAKQILNTPSIIDPMISAILFKKEREEAALLAKQSKQARKLRVVNHIAATGKNIEDRMLLLAEGLSAIGQLVECRKSSEKIGGYPLKGKIMNVSGMKPVDIMKNKEIAELLSIIGLEFGKPAIDLNYGKIVFMVDQDVDGNGHICSLLLNLFSNWPELFTAGRIYQLVTPLYICKKGKEVKRFYSKEEFDKADLKGYTIEYMKGLGSLSKEEYSLAINEPTLMQFKNSDSFESLTMAFAGSADDRKKWMML